MPVDGNRITRLVGGATIALLLLYWMRKGGAREGPLEERIKSEGGTLLRSGMIGFLFVDPFKHSTTDASGHTFTVRYGDRSGTWFVRTSRVRPEGEWLWVDDAGGEGLPVPREDDSRAVPPIRRVPGMYLFLVFVVLIGLLFLWARLGRRG